MSGILSNAPQGKESKKNPFIMGEVQHRSKLYMIGAALYSGRYYRILYF